MITTVTLNPMLDKTVRLQRIVPGRITRAHAVSAVVGGKGVNVARQLGRLGCDVIATGVWGGEIGSQLDRLLTAEGLRHEFLRIAGMTREGVTYLDAEGLPTSVFEPPHDVTGAETGAFLTHAKGIIDGSSWVACCGSSPCAPCDSVFADLFAYARSRGVHTALDSYGEAFRRALQSVPDLVKVNREEYQAAAGIPLDTESRIMDALLALVERGVRLAVLTDGPRPCYAATPTGCWKITPPFVACVNATGSGDSMLAGILYGLTRGWEVPQSICFGAAAGAANSAVWNVSDASLQDIASLVPRLSVVELDYSSP